MVPDVPFQAGQIIELSSMTDQAKSWIADGRAEIVGEARETAALGAPAAVAADHSAAKRRGAR
jgi:hypothetical protein